MKPLDKTKKSNRKCEHCKNFEHDPATIRTVHWGTCHIVEKCHPGELHLRRKTRYWNTCKDFAWREV